MLKGCTEKWEENCNISNQVIPFTFCSGNYRAFFGIYWPGPKWKRFYEFCFLSSSHVLLAIPHYHMSPNLALFLDQRWRFHAGVTLWKPDTMFSYTAIHFYCRLQSDGRLEFLKSEKIHKGGLSARFNQVFNKSIFYFGGKNYPFSFSLASYTFRLLFSVNEINGTF